MREKEKKHTYSIALKPELLFLLATVISIFLFYFRTVFYEVKAFDEIIPLKEAYLPTCNSFSEMFELISLLGLKQHFEASNTFYSHITSLRCNPIGNFLQMFIQVLFRKNPVNYHLYGLFLHIINSILVFLILNKISSLYFKFGIDAKKLIVTSLFTFLWATHPANIESVLLLSNANIILSYMFCFIATYFFLEGKNFLLYCIPYTLSLFVAEFNFFLPMVLFLMSYFIKGSIKQSLKSCMPLFLVTLLYAFLFIFSKTSVNLQVNTSLQSILERIFWFSPQILFHLIKLTFLPIKLSIDQAALVQLGKTLLDPYAIFCILFILIVFLGSLLDLFKAKTRPPFLFFTSTLFLLSLLPFSHLLAPFYNLASERYLYYPTFALILGLSFFAYHIMIKDEKNKNVVLVLVILLTVIYSSRAFIRTLDWKDSFTLYDSAINVSGSNLYKGFRYKGLVSQDEVFSNMPHRAVSEKYQLSAVDYLKKSLNELKDQKEIYKSSTPEVLKDYGLDPESLYLKAGYLYAHSVYTLHRDPNEALGIMKPFMENLKLQDNSAAAFYAALLYYDKKYDEAEKILREALTFMPYSKKIIFPFCEIIMFRKGYTKEVDELLNRAFIYFPYDSLAILEMLKYTLAQKDYEKYAFFSYIYGLRAHSIDDLINAKNVYERLGKKDMAIKVEKSINNQGHNL